MASTRKRPSNLVEPAHVKPVVAQTDAKPTVKPDAPGPRRSKRHNSEENTPLQEASTSEAVSLPPPKRTRVSTTKASTGTATTAVDKPRSGKKAKALTEGKPACPKAAASKRSRKQRAPAALHQETDNEDSKDPVAILDASCEPELQQVPRLPSSPPQLFDPRQPDHVAAVRNVLAISGSRLGDGLMPLGRQQQYQQLHASLSTCCKSGLGRSVYISGLPGTGKTFTVQRAMQALASEHQPAPISITINCMALADSKDVYTALITECSRALLSGKAGGKQTPHTHLSTSSLGGADEAFAALVELLQFFGKKGGASGRSGPLLVVVLEEVDRLLDKGPDEVYRLFMLPHTPGVHLALVAIANSLDLTERMLPALKCRGASPDFVCFPAYSKTQVQSILTSTVGQLPWKVFEEGAIELVARTVSGTTGDLRQAFKVCRTAVDMLVETHKQAAKTEAVAAAARSEAATAAAAPRSDPAAAASLCDAPEQQQQAPPKAVGPKCLIGMREMLPAVRMLTGSSGSNAAMSTVKALPNLQQLVLLAVSLAVAGADAASAAVRIAEEAGASAASVSYAAARAKKHVNPFAAIAEEGDADVNTPGRSHAPPSGAGRGGALTPGSASKSRGLSGDSALRVPSRDVYDRYGGLCKELFMRPVPLPEFMHTCTLLSEQALINLIGGGGGARGSGQPKMSLKVLAGDVRSALQTNPIYRNVIGG